MLLEEVKGMYPAFGRVEKFWFERGEKDEEVDTARQNTYDFATQRA